jgi:hypothetical protein
MVTVAVDCHAPTAPAGVTISAQGPDGGCRAGHTNAGPCGAWRYRSASGRRKWGMHCQPLRWWEDVILFGRYTMSLDRDAMNSVEVDYKR